MPDSLPTDTDANPPRTTRVAACVCTYRRNEPLRTLLRRFGEIGDAAAGRYELGVVVVDDNADGAAQPVVEEFRDAFPLGVHYRRSGKQNISLARNLAIDTGAEIADVVVMTDDDCLPEIGWIDALLATKAATGADSVSGPMITDIPPEAPAWLFSQQVFDDEHEQLADGSTIDLGQTNNCLLDAAWLRSHAEHRFDPEYGRIGGEDMVFFKGAVRLGLRSVHSADARVHAVEPLEEVRLRALLRSRYWWGNSEATTNLANGEATRSRLVLRGGRRLGRALVRPFARLGRGQPPHVRYALIKAAGAVGVVTGGLGVRAKHH